MKPCHEKTCFLPMRKQRCTFVFVTKKEQCLYIINPKFQASSHLLWLYSWVCVGGGWKPQGQVFSQHPQINVVGAHQNQNSLSEVILMWTHHIIIFNTYNTKLIQNLLLKYHQISDLFFYRSYLQVMKQFWHLYVPRSRLSLSSESLSEHSLAELTSTETKIRLVYKVMTKYSKK